MEPLPPASPGRRGVVPWDPEVLARVRRLHLLARVLSDRLLIGQHRTRRVGQAIEFADHQPYVRGADPRRIDWKVAARADRLVIKRHEAESDLPCTVVLDLSGDLSTGRDGRRGRPDLRGTKAGTAIVLAATLLAWLSRQGEPVGLTLVGGEGARLPDLPPRRGRGHLQLAYLQLASVRPAGRADLAAALTRVAGRTRRRSLVVVLSDGMEEPGAWLPALRAFGRRGADLRFVHLWDEAELGLKDDRAALYFSPEGGESLALDPAGARREMAAVVEAYLAEVRSGVAQAGGRYVAAPSDLPLERVLHRIARGGPG